MFARRSTSDGAFTLSKRAVGDGGDGRRRRSRRRRADGRVTLDDVEEFVEERKRAANDARARSVGNALLAASLAWSAARRAWEAWRRRREARAGTATTERRGGGGRTADDARDDARDETNDETREGSRARYARDDGGGRDRGAEVRARARRTRARDGGGRGDDDDDDATDETRTFGRGSVAIKPRCARCR